MVIDTICYLYMFFITEIKLPSLPIPQNEESTTYVSQKYAAGS